MLDRQAQATERQSPEIQAVASGKSPIGPSRVLAKTPSAPSFETHPRIYKRVNQIRQKVHDYIRHGDQKNAPLQERIVARFYRLHRQTADTRPREDCLRNDRSRQQGAKL